MLFVQCFHGIVLHHLFKIKKTHIIIHLCNFLKTMRLKNYKKKVALFEKYFSINTTIITPYYFISEMGGNQSLCNVSTVRLLSPLIIRVEEVLWHCHCTVQSNAPNLIPFMIVL